MKTCLTCGAALEDAARECDRCVNDAVTGVRVRPSSAGAGALLCNRYEIVEELGRGGMGVVYRARDRERRNADVALKTLAPELAADPAAVEALGEEADLAMSLAHPNIIRLHNLERDPASGTRFLIMEYVRGESLAGLLKRRGPLPPDEAVGLVRQALAGLHHAHSRDVVHRDIKPSNLLRAEEGAVKVGDFGIARRAKEALSRLTGRAASGTLLYMSPEQLRGEREDRRTDVYSMGCVLYELLSGQPPFRTGSIEWQIQNQAPARIPSVPTAIWDAISKALSKERTDRFGSCAEFASALERKAAPEPSSAPSRGGAAEGKPAAAPPPAAPPVAPPPVVPAPAPAAAGGTGTTCHYVFVNLARLALVAAMVVLGLADNHVEVAGKDEYAAAFIGGAGAAGLFFLIAAIFAWSVKNSTGKPIGGTWHPALRFLLVLPALGAVVGFYVWNNGSPAPALASALHQSAAMFGALAFLLFLSFFAVRISKTIVGGLLAAAIVCSPWIAEEIRGKSSLPSSRFSGNKVFTPELPPEKEGAGIVLRPIDDHSLFKPVQEYVFANRVVNFGGGVNGNDVLDLWITGNADAMRRISSVSYQFPQGWQPSFQSSSNPGNSFAIRFTAHTRFTLTAHLTMWDGNRRTVTQEIRWK